MSNRNNAGRGLKVFEPRWGIHQSVLAEQEGITEAAILMRVCHFDTPWQRKRKPSLPELLYGRTWKELSDSTGMGLPALMNRQNENGDIRLYHGKPDESIAWDKVFQQDSGAGLELNARARFWLRPEHPDYEEARKPIWHRSGDHVWSVKSCRL